MRGIVKRITLNYIQKKGVRNIELLIILLGYPDSNQEKQDQNLLCYHYTIAQTYKHPSMGHI